MKQHIETAAIALGLGVLAFVAYRAAQGARYRPPTAPSEPINYQVDYTPNLYTPADANIDYSNARDRLMSRATAGSGTGLSPLQ